MPQSAGPCFRISSPKQRPNSYLPGLRSKDGAGNFAAGELELPMGVGMTKTCGLMYAISENYLKFPLPEELDTSESRAVCPSHTLHQSCLEFAVQDLGWTKQMKNVSTTFQVNFAM